MQDYCLESLKLQRIDLLSVELNGLKLDEDKNYVAGLGKL